MVAVVVDGLCGAIGQHNLELTVEQHALLAALEGADVEGACALGPGEDDIGVVSLLIVVVVALILIEAERAVGAGVEADLEVVP